MSDKVQPFSHKGKYKSKVGTVSTLTFTTDDFSCISAQPALFSYLLRLPHPSNLGFKLLNYFTQFLNNSAGNTPEFGVLLFLHLRIMASACSILIKLRILNFASSKCWYSWSCCQQLLLRNSTDNGSAFSIHVEHYSWGPTGIEFVLKWASVTFFVEKITYKLFCIL